MHVYGDSERNERDMWTVETEPTTWETFHDPRTESNQGKPALGNPQLRITFDPGFGETFVSGCYRCGVVV